MTTPFTPAPPAGACGCSPDADAPDAPCNDPGLPALAYRVDTQPGFHRRMLQGLALARPGPGSDARPLARLLTRSADDPAVAFLDAAACVADVLSFYQERIANEGFIGTATERRSVLELARAIGYELKPGVAASVYLAFTVEDAPGAPGVVELAAGTAAQSVPAQGQMPQVFETAEAFTARAEWNALRPRRTRPADLALLDVDGAPGKPRKALVLLGPVGSFEGAQAGLHGPLASAALDRLDATLPVEAQVDALEVRRVYVSEAAGPIAPGELLLFAARRPGAAEFARLVLRVVAVAAEPALRRLRVELEPLPEPAAKPLPPLRWRLPFAIRPFTALAQVKLDPIPFTAQQVAGTVMRQAWRESELQALIGIQRWSPLQLLRAVAAPPLPAPAAAPVEPVPGVFAFGARLGFFGSNAPKWKLLPKASDAVNGQAYAEGWDSGDTAGAGEQLPRSVWEDSQGASLAPQHAWLERAVPGVVRGGWVVFDAPDVSARAWTVFDAREASRADFGLSGRALGLRLAGDDGQPLAAPPADRFTFREATAHVASRALALAPLPIEAPVAAGTRQVELDAMVLGLAPGQALAFVGEVPELPGVAVAEIAVLDDTVHADGRSTLLLREGLSHGYARESLRISANVVKATHGETVREVLGNGDAAVPNQRFTLSKPAVTHLSADGGGGARSTLELRVNGVRWDEVPALYGAAPDAPVFMARIDDDARMQLTFGDGVQGARLPTGTLNVAARYRSGIGPGGEVAAGAISMLRALPPGLRGVTNPVPAAGAEAPQRLADARRNAPLTLQTFERVVSLRDYAQYARAHAGIGKARGDLLWLHGEARVFVTVAGATGGLPGADVLGNLRRAIAAASDPGQRFAVGACVLRYFRCRLRVAADGRRVAAEVRAAVAAALREAFGFEARELAQSVTAAEVLALAQAVPGVVAVDLEELQAYGAAAPAGLDAAQAAVPAFGARPGAKPGEVTPAELLLLDPAGAVVEELNP